MKKIHVIHHTHWDFEWYFTRDEALIQFVYHMDEVFAALQAQKVDYYLLDGQMSILDDYLDAYPEKSKEIKKWVNAGRLFIGPWYTQTDELIITGESIVRNLSLGMEMAQRLGGAQPIGYLPDSFGQGADMPKIYNGMNIKNAVFWRGMPKEKTANREFIWKSEDGSQVNVANIKNGYFVGVGLIEDDDAKNMMTTVVQGASVDDVPLPVGGDQRYVDFNLKERISFYNQQLDDAKLVESNYVKYFQDLKQHQNELDQVTGEFIDPSVSKIHRSIYSSRYDQKYLNDKVERRMIYQVEPLMAMAERAGIPYKKALLDKIWKLIVRNHAHDSAGGCNSDKTNRMILARLVEADQLSYSVVDYLTRKITESDVNYGENTITFFNTLPYPITKRVKFQLSLKNPAFKLMKDDQKVMVDVEKVTKEYHGQIKRDTSAYRDDDFYYKIDCSARINLPALQWESFDIVASETVPALLGNTTEKSISDNHFKIEWVDGKLNLTNLKDQTLVEDFMYIEDGGDEGDTYDYSPAYKDQVYRLDFKDAAVTTRKGRVTSQLILQGTWAVPVDLAARAENLRNQQINYQLELELDGSGRINHELQIHNEAKDHRMRVINRTNIYAKASYADTGFGYIKRPVVDPHLKDWQAIGYHEEPTAIFPMIHYVNVHDDKRSVSFLTKGIKEYQITGAQNDRVALTLFRSVGYLGRPDLLRRPGVASGNQFTYIPTPDSQLQKEMHFKWAIYISKQFDPAEVSKEFMEYAVTNPNYQAQDLNQFTNTLKYFVMHPLKNTIKAQPFFELVDRRITFSSLTKGIEKISFQPGEVKTFKIAR
ncbi:glycoside hydrolase family 38 C-terminal domain-containing protein [Pediococcus acidilactici]|uniref:glycoside hydrolase family 38 N-terminal domain-containing protein n=1 Tax=Pediococcus acidilactici TaxID=1254 RepID=UPI002704C730|nr:glycoside hydrolase family 38 C-terminal domain-containing protein [Pediococcus acidilactici]MDO7801666.1 glycoside hydrolase family 38 C-terminal domain-containing protein [Pediococcus acidilactici]